jgi:hypothetical protein
LSETTINQRIKILVDELDGGNKLAFSKRVGMSNQGLGEIIGERQSTPSYPKLEKMLRALPQVRMEWLLLGEGEMLKASRPHKSITTETNPEEGNIDYNSISSDSNIKFNGQVYKLDPGQWEQLFSKLLEITASQAKAEVELDYLSRTFHFGDKPTPGLKYDDRISKRMNLNKKEMQEWMDSPQFSEVRCVKIGNRLTITERAIRELFGDIPKLT